jgi:hypothetical protein
MYTLAHALEERRATILAVMRCNRRPSIPTQSPWADLITVRPKSVVRSRPKQFRMGLSPARTTRCGQWLLFPVSPCPRQPNLVAALGRPCPPGPFFCCPNSYSPSQSTSHSFGQLHFVALEPLWPSLGFFWLVTTEICLHSQPRRVNSAKHYLSASMN